MLSMRDRLIIWFPLSDFRVAHPTQAFLTSSCLVCPTTLQGQLVLYQILAPTISSFATLGKLSNLAVPLCLHLPTRMFVPPHRLMRGLCELIYAKPLERPLTHSKNLVTVIIMPLQVL